MGKLLDLFRPPPAEVTAALLTTAYPDPSRYPIASPWSPGGDLAQVLWRDVYGVDEIPISTRLDAMRIPTIARARNRICSTIADLPLVDMRVDQRTDPQPAWLSDSPRSGQSPQHRLAWTVDDLIFTGWSCWWADRNADGSIADAHRIDRNEWEIDDDRNVLIDGLPVRDPRNVIVIPGLHEGILTLGGGTNGALTDARALYRAVRQRLRNPIPQVELHQTSGRRLTEPEIDTLIDRWAAARRGENGGVGYTSPEIELNERGGGDGEQFLVDARNAAAVDLARLVGVSASVVDATAPKASLNYETTSGRNTEFVDVDLKLYLLPITARLSRGDVTPRGRRVAFDLAAYTSPSLDPTGPNAED